MLIEKTLLNVAEKRQVIRDYYRIAESDILQRLVEIAELSLESQGRVRERATKLSVEVRELVTDNKGIQALLNEYSLSSEEGVVLMCLAEALLRIPDSETADGLIRDKLMSGDWQSHIGQADSLFVNSSAWGLMLTGKLVSLNDERKSIAIASKLLGKLSEPVIRQAMRLAMRIMGNQFVLGRDIEEANKRAKKQEAKGYCYSYDMLGEGARTMPDAEYYFDAYRQAIDYIGQASAGQNHIESAGISVKLSAIHPRYEFAQRDRVFSELLPRLKQLVLLAKKYNIGFTVDAEESYRLDLSMDIIEAVFTDPDLDGWEGFGFAIQAYQRRAIDVTEWAIELCQKVGRKMMLRLVKGAYWDTEIKLAQVEGQTDYPVFTRKAATDVSYQACARRLLENRAFVYPQFATHNAYTVAAIQEIAGESGSQSSGYEFQRLHGMGDELYHSLLSQAGSSENQQKVACRIYAPVGKHEDLLAYLVRRLLENGANTSFVNNIIDDETSIDDLVADPVSTVKEWAVKHNQNIPFPKDLYGAERLNSNGMDVSDIDTLVAVQQNVENWKSNSEASQKQADENQQGKLISTSPINTSDCLGVVPATSPEQFDEMLNNAHNAFAEWSSTDVQQRVDCLNKLADLLEEHRDELIAICLYEAGKTLLDAVNEVREAIDFCRYYAVQAEELSDNNKQLQARGTVLCISPWNFPLAIFLGQVTAALAVGNSVVAKPAEQTVLIADRVLDLVEQAGFSKHVLQLVNAAGRVIGEHLVPDERIKAVMFTGSTQTAMWIARKLSEREDAVVPLIAETGGQNCMLVDSSALTEQVVDDVVASGFQSAGQRCSALRVLFLQEEIADKTIEMIIGAMQQLSVGDPTKLSTDVGPVIDQKALSALSAHADLMKQKGKLLYQCELDEICDNGTFFAPRLYEIDDISVLEQEVFGPCVHVVRYKAGKFHQTIEAINSTGFGLTSGIHSRIELRTQQYAEQIEAGNIYVNRNMIGAIVGVQPFGGHGLSGTGPKAGGPSYLYRLVEHELDKQAFSSDELPSESYDKPEANVETVEAQLSQLATTDVMDLQARKEGLSTLVNHSAHDGWKERFNEISKLSEKELNSPMDLPGPTGEQNQLFSVARGVLLAINNAANPDQLLIHEQQLLTAILAGNRVLQVNLPTSLPSLLVNQLGQDSEVCLESVVCGDDSVMQLVEKLAIDGVMLQNNGGWVKRVEQILAKREGMLLPLLADTAPLIMLKRCVLEKVVSIDTTASGGNASLLASGEA